MLRACTAGCAETAAVAGRGAPAPVAAVAPVTSATPATVAVADVPADVAALVRDFRGDEATRNAARARLEAMGPAVLPAVLTFIHDPDFTTRWEVVNLLGTLRDRRGTRPLVERVLRDENPHVRWRALWALTAVGDSETARLFKAALDADDPHVRWNAAVGLGVLEDPASVPRLHEGLKSADPWVRWEAANGLGKVHDDATSGLLAGLLAAPATENDLKREATLALGRIGDGRAVAALVAALGDADAGVRWRAAMGLARVHDPATLPAIEERLRTETDADTRRELEEARKAARRR